MRTCDNCGNQSYFYIRINVPAYIRKHRMEWWCKNCFEDAESGVVRNPGCVAPGTRIKVIYPPPCACSGDSVYFERLPVYPVDNDPPSCAAPGTRTQIIQPPIWPIEVQALEDKVSRLRGVVHTMLDCNSSDGLCSGCRRVGTKAYKETA